MTAKNDCMCGICPLFTECPKAGEWGECKINKNLVYEYENERLAELGSVLLFMATQKVGFKRLDEAVINHWTERYREHVKINDSVTSPPELHTS